MVEVSSDLTRDTEPAHAVTTPVSAEEAAVLVIGEQLGGRYLIRAFLGEGGMGAVYRATDEKLGEDVALKVVRGVAEVARLRDEVRLAQKVTHGNVCRTYDLEEVGGRQLVKMEFIDGETLAARLARDGKLAIDEAVRVARAIAAGLAAAHAQGIVHRDLKPSNVMLSGERVVLMDFGIASRVATAGDSEAGTLGYMAPEQLANTNVDDRADLYALGCLLYEMLAGEQVFRVASRIELAARHVSMPAPDVRELRAEVPRWLARATGELLAKDPGRRPAGVRRLVQGARRPYRTGLFALALAGALAAGAILASSRQSGSQLCKGIDRRLDGVWDPDVRRQAQLAFLATKKPFAAPAFATVAAQLDDHTAQWVQASVGACEATRIRGEESEEVLALRQGCLDERLEDLRALTELLRHADDQVVEHAVGSVGAVSDLAGCTDVAALRAPGQPSPAIRDEVARIQAKIAAGRAALAVGKVGGAINNGTAAAEAARAIRYAPVEASAYEIVGLGQLEASDNEDALRSLTSAVWAAERGRRDDLAANAAMFAAQAANALDRPDEAALWIAFAGAAGSRQKMTADFDPLRLQIEGAIAGQRGELDKALVAHVASYTVARQRFGDQPSHLAVFENVLAATYTKRGAFRRALPLYEHSLAALEAAEGPNHPDLASILSGLGLCYSHTGELTKARAAFERSIAIREQILGANSIALVPSLNNFAESLRTHDPPAALAMIERARKLAAPLGNANPQAHVLQTTYAETLYANGRTAEARTAFDELVAVEERTRSATLATTLTSRAALELGEQAWPAAARYAERAIAAIEQADGKTAPDLWQPLLYLARAKLGAGDPAAARPLLERSLDIATRAQLDAEELAQIRSVRDSLAK